MTFTIRTAVPDDMEAVQDVFRRSALSNEADRTNLLAHPDALELSDASVNAGRTRMAVTADGSIIGFATGLPAGGAIELDDLFVDPGWMRRGVGRALVLDIVEHARKEGFTRVEVTANQHALAFYEAVGFVFDRLVATRFGPALRMRLDVAVT